VADPARPKVAWAWDGSYVFRSVDGGIVWRHGRVTDALWRRGAVPWPWHCTDVDAQPGTAVVLATCHYWIYRSVNRGATWRRVGPTRFPLPDRAPPRGGGPPDFESLAFDPAHPGVVVATAVRARGQRPQLWRSTNSGRTWRTVAAPNVSRAPLVAGPRLESGDIRVTAGAGQIIVGPFASAGAPVFLVSGDGGVTWSIHPLPTTLPGRYSNPEIPDPARAAGSATALFMPIRYGKEQIWGYRSTSPLWGAMSFFTPPPPPGTE
jgi:hypothetical protein